MLKKITLSTILVFFLIQYINISAYAARNGTIKGTIKDAQSGEVLPYANVILIGTSLGDAADSKGNFNINNVPPGNYKIRVSYLGYKNIDLDIVVTDGDVIEKDFELSAEGVIGSEVVVTAQAQGQYEAINEQLNSIAIKNVVSMAKIRELPDANAAESVSRLPGVSLIRTGGEGSKVVVRGLSPQYNRVTIDGVELPANVTSSDPNDHKSELRASDEVTVSGDRATDLSMISSNMLGGIEVIKAITPDMDATVFGGVINFSMRKAILSEVSKPMFELQTQGSYNNLKNTYNDYKVVGSYEQRFMDSQFGMFVQGSVEKRNLSSNQLNSNYYFEGLITSTDVGNPEFISMDLADILRRRDRYGATVVLDYNFETGNIGFMNFFSRSNTETTSRKEQYSLENNTLYNDASHSKSTLDVFSNLLSYKQSFGFINVDARVSHSYSETGYPDDVHFRFWQDHNAGFQGKYMALRYKSPKEIASYIKHDPENAAFFSIDNTSSIAKDRTFNTGLDLSTDLTFTDYLSTKIKVGGAYQYRKRSEDYNENSGSMIWDEGTDVSAAVLRAYPQFGGNIDYADFIDQGYDYGEFLNGDYSLGEPLNVDLMLNVIKVANRNQGIGDGGGYKRKIFPSIKDDYDGTENRSAVYGMATINIGQMFTILPGARYQNLTTTYSGRQGETDPKSPAGMKSEIVSKTVSHGYLLPMLHFRFKPLEWLQFHFAYTNTLNYPDYHSIIPKYYIGSSWIEYNNYRLKPARSENFDAVLSIYANEIGLISVGGFKKNIKNLIFSQKTYPSDFSAYPELYEKLKDRKESYVLFTFINNPIKIDIYGLEAEWQTHFWYLPEPLSGIVLDINFTHIFSEAKYPKSQKVTKGVDPITWLPIIVGLDTLYSDRLLNQPNDIINISFGYDYASFSIRGSMLYQDNIFKKPDFWAQNRIQSAKYVRYDLSIKQGLPWYGLQLFFNLNNISGEDDIDVNKTTGYTTLQQRYGMSADFGIRMNL